MSSYPKYPQMRLCCTMTYNKSTIAPHWYPKWPGWTPPAADSALGHAILASVL